VIANTMKIQVWLKASNDQINGFELETPDDAKLFAMSLPTDGAYTITVRKGDGTGSIGIAGSVYNDPVDRYIKPFSETGKPSCVIPLHHKRRFERVVPPKE
jgi:hypothetical protein